MDAFGTYNDWSTWSGSEIGCRILHFLNTKMHSDIHEPSQANAEPSLITASTPSEKADDTSFFFNYSEPPISLEDYINRLVYYTRISVSPVNLAVALFYLDRIEKKRVCVLNKYSVFRRFAVAYLIAFKHMEDLVVMRNSEYCKIAGISLSELNKLEVIFLTAIEFDLCVGSDIAVAQQITRILVPPKISPTILLFDKTYLPTGAAHLHQSQWTPDSVAHAYSDIDNNTHLVEEETDEYDNEDDAYDRMHFYNYSGLPAGH